MWKQVEFDLQSRRRGFHLITGEILRNLPPLPRSWITAFIYQTHFRRAKY